ncbi:hypothetical protein Sjap_018993 [Stephania japonica]|uniref:Transmembrane protein n=1 Tax=Stephania japonica TaxID=461633 RepID=A0AAP0F6V1_9MAGN
MKSLSKIHLLFLFMIVFINGASITFVQAGRTFPGADVQMINRIIDGENFVVEMIRNYYGKGTRYVPPSPKDNPKSHQSVLRRSPPPLPPKNPSYSYF